MLWEFHWFIRKQCPIINLKRRRLHFFIVSSNYYTHTIVKQVVFYSFNTPTIFLRIYLACLKCALAISVTVSGWGVECPQRWPDTPVQTCCGCSGQTGTQNLSSEFDSQPLWQQSFLWTCMTSGEADWVSLKKKLSIRSQPPWRGGSQRAPPGVTVPYRGSPRTPLHLQQGQTMDKMMLKN